jgi:hypothetical protein
LSEIIGPTKFQKNIPRPNTNRNSAVCCSVYFATLIKKSGENAVIVVKKIIKKFEIKMFNGYRYVKELSNAGLLARVKGVSYVIGPKIIKLDHQIRISDPIIKIGKPFMENLVQLTGCEILLANIYPSPYLLKRKIPPIIQNCNFQKYHC